MVEESAQRARFGRREKRKADNVASESLMGRCKNYNSQFFMLHAFVLITSRRKEAFFAELDERGEVGYVKFNFIHKKFSGQ